VFLFEEMEKRLLRFAIFSRMLLFDDFASPVRLVLLLL